MSSEKRFIAWNILESDVPPLNRSLPEKSSIEKSCFSTQQTQKSFSIMASGKTFRSAVSANRSARSRADIWATLFTLFSPRSFSPLHKSSPRRTGHLSRVGASLPATGFFATSLFRACPLHPCPGNEALEQQAPTYLQALPLLSGERA